MDSEIKKKGRVKGSKNLSYTDNKTIGIRLDPKTIEVLSRIAVNNHTTVNKLITSLAVDFAKNNSNN